VAAVGTLKSWKAAMGIEVLTICSLHLNISIRGAGEKAQMPPERTAKEMMHKGETQVVPGSGECWKLLRRYYGKEREAYLRLKGGYR